MTSPYFPVGLQIDEPNEEIFYEVVDRLKDQGALPNHCFIKHIPYFNVPSLPKETQIRELFENSCDAETCKQLLQNIVPLAADAECKIAPQNYSEVSVMSFGQIILYKVLPCLHINCSNCPREIATHNQYKDFEYECPFYHHERDRRRLVITKNAEEEFIYKANYFEEGRRPYSEKDKYSQNYFESMFHPLYYKMFRCKRDFCNHSAFCPFYHTEQEKNTWDQTFKNLVGKDRVSFLKEKQKGSERKYKGQENKRRGMINENSYIDQNYYYSGRHVQFGLGSFNQKYQQMKTTIYQEDQIENPKLFFERKLSDWKMEFTAQRKDSDSSFEEKYGYGFLSKLQEKNHFEIY